MKSHRYGHRRPEIGASTLALGWITGVRHLVSRAAQMSKWHRHRTTTLVYCLRGKYEYEFRDMPGATLVLNSFIVVPPGLEHRHARATDPTGARVELLFEPTGPAHGKYLFFSQSVLDAVRERLCASPCVAHRCDAGLAALFQSLAAFAARGENNLDEIEKAHVRLICGQIFLACAQAATNVSCEADPHLMDEAVRWIESHMADRLDIDRLVAHIGYSRTHFFTLFRNYTGLTPADYLTRHRIRKARQLLAETDMPVHVVARVCGFSSPTTFNAVFKRLTSLTPLAWRTRNSESSKDP